MADEQSNKEKNSLSYENLINLEEFEFSDSLKKMLINNKAPLIDNIKNKCISNLLENKNILKNYLLLIKLDKLFHFTKNSFKHQEIEQIFNQYKTFFLENKQNIENNNVNYEIINKQSKIIIDIFKLFFKIYDNEKELNEFLNENISTNEEYLNNYLTDIENKKSPFTKKEEIEFYELILLYINSLKKRLVFKIKGNISIINPKLIHLDNYFSLFIIQENEEIINEMILFIYKLYGNINNIKYLYEKIKDILISSESSNIIRLYKYTIDKLEEDFIIKKKSHFSLCKNNIITIKYIGNEKEKKQELNFYGNTTINEVYNYLNSKYESEKEYYIISLKTEKEKKNIILNNIDDKSFSNKTLNELKKKNYEITISKKEIVKDKLFENDNLTEKFQNEVLKFFNYFSKGKDTMSRKEFVECLRKLLNIKEVLSEYNMFVIIFFKLYSDNYKYITQENFLNFFCSIFKENDKEKINYIWIYIKNMNLLPDLTEIPQEIKEVDLPRYYLSNKKNENTNLYLFDELMEKYKTSLNEEILDFILCLSTNENMYNDILNNFNSDENMKFTKKMDEYIKNFYILGIIENIFEDVIIMKNKIKTNISLGDYNPFYTEENNKKKNQFFVDFLNSNYSDLIEYTSYLLKKINEDEDYNEKKHNIIIRCCIICLKIINRIYNLYYNIKWDIAQNEESNIKAIEYESMKNIIDENKLEKNIKDNSAYKDLIVSILIFIDKYFNKTDTKFENKKIIINLINNCYFILISLLLTNDGIIDKEKEKEILIKIMYNILVDNNKKTYLLKINLILKENKIQFYSSSFLSFLISLSFQINEDFIFGKINKLERIYFVFLRNLIKTILNKEQLYAIFKSQTIKIYQILFNHMNSKNEEINKINELNLFNIIDDLTKVFDQLKLDIFKNDIINYKFNDEISFYDLCLNQINKFEEKNIDDKNYKYKLLESILEEDKNNKLISEGKIQNINKINNKQNSKDDNNNNLFKFPYQYCTLFLNSNNNNQNLKKNIMQIIMKLIDLKGKEDNEYYSLDGLQLKKEKSIYKALKTKLRLKNLSKRRIKKKSPYIGIRNIGNICYLSSVIQQLYMIPQFRYSILGVDDNKKPKKSELLEDDNILHQLQTLFTYLSFSSFGEVIPKNFIFSIKDYEGNPINPCQMQDSNEFYTRFCDIIEESLKNTKYGYLINNLFMGKIYNKKICNSCNNLSYSFEDFKSLTLEVNGLNNIYESLDKYISEENIDDYQCSECNKKVSLKKASFLSSLPNILIIHLNRIQINLKDGTQKKVNSKFEFPKELNLKKYCIEDKVDDNERIYKKKDDYYKYKLKGIIIHKGTGEGGHYISITNVDKDIWFQFDDSKVTEFDIKNLEEECFGGINSETKEEKKKSAYLLFYEMSKQKPIKLLLNESEIPEKNEENIIKYNQNDLERIEKEYDITKLKDSYNEKELFNKLFHNNNEKENIYYKYISYDKIEKEIPKEYFLEVIKDNKSYDYLYGIKTINFNNNLVKLLLKLLKNGSFDIKTFSIEEYKDLANIFINIVISYLSDDNLRKMNNKEYNEYIINIINKIFIPLFKKENEEFFNENKETILDFLDENLFSASNIKLIFVDSIKEISEKIYEIMLDYINVNKKNKNINLNESINKVINERDNISSYLYKILYKIIIKNNDDNDDINNITSESFMTIYYKLYKESTENLKEISNIFRYLIVKKKIFVTKNDFLEEIKLKISDLLLKNLLDSSIHTLILLIKNLQYNDENFSEKFNLNDIQKLYTYCKKEEDKELIKKRQINLIKLIIGILGINDKFVLKRIQILLGYPTMIIKRDKKKNISLFGVSIMNNDINSQIFRYISYNQIKKERCVLSFLFPSLEENDGESQLTENDRNYLIYKLIQTCFGLNEEKEGNYFLFKYLYLMQSRSLKYDNLYQEMKDILEKANEANNNQYNLSEIKKDEEECINLIKYELEDINERISFSKNRSSIYRDENKKIKIKPQISEIFISSTSMIDEKDNKDFNGIVNDIIPHEIGKIKIELIATSKNLSIFRLEYFTTYFTKQELVNLSNDNKEFIYKYVKRRNIEEINEILEDKEKEKEKEEEEIDFSILKEKKNEKDFIIYINNIIKENKIIVIENKEVINKKEIKSTLIRYYILSKKNNVMKVNVIKDEGIEKDIKNNYCLPDQIYYLADEDHVGNLFNIHRIKNEFNFLESSSITINMKTMNPEKYFKEYLE